MFRPELMGQAASAEVELLRGKLANQRVTFMIGAGLSKSSPTDLPVAGELAIRLYQQFENTFAAEALAKLGPEARSNLLAVADAIASSGTTALRILQDY